MDCVLLSMARLIGLQTMSGGVCWAVDFGVGLVTMCLFQWKVFRRRMILEMEHVLDKCVLGSPSCDACAR